MATVKLEMSEYQEMQDKIELLRQQLELNKEQSEKIEQLQQQKIEVMMENENTVTIVNKTVVQEDVVEYLGFNDSYMRLHNYFHKPHSIRQSDMDITKVVQLARNMISIEPRETTTISKVRSQSLENIKAELKEEIREEFKDELSSAESKLETYSNQADKYREEKYEALTELAKVKIDLTNAEADIESHVEENNKLEELVFCLESELEGLKDRVVTDEILNILNSGVTVLNYKSKFQKIKTLLQ